LVVIVSLKPCQFAHRVTHMDPSTSSCTHNAKYNLKQKWSQSDWGAVDGWLPSANKAHSWTYFQLTTLGNLPYKHHKCLCRLWALILRSTLFCDANTAHQTYSALCCNFICQVRYYRISYIRCIPVNGISGRKITNHMVIIGLYIWFWPTPRICNPPISE